MFSTTDTTKENLAALLFQAIRAKADNYSDERLEHSTELRKSINHSAMQDCKKIIPIATDDDWKEAVTYLGEKYKLSFITQ